MRPLVIVRPEPGASTTARAAEQLGLCTIVMPLFEIKPVDWKPPVPADFDGIVLTSANAVRFGGEGLQKLGKLPAYCVGEATAAEARDAYLSIAAVGSGGIEALLALLPPDLRLLHLCGTERRAPNVPRQTIHAIPVYRAVELPPPGSISDIDGAVVAVHSPRSASRLSAIADSAGLGRESIAIAAISADAATAAGEGWQTVEAARQPNDADLLALAASLCNNCWRWSGRGEAD